MQENKGTGPKEEMDMNVLWNLPRRLLSRICLTICSPGASFHPLSWQSPQTPLHSSLPLSPLMRTCVAPSLPFPSSSFKTIIREMTKIGSLIDLSPLPDAPSFQRLTCFLSNTANLSSTTWPAHLPFVHFLPEAQKARARKRAAL